MQPLTLLAGDAVMVVGGDMLYVGKSGFIQN